MQNMYLVKLADSLAEVLAVVTGEACTWSKVDSTLPAINDRMIFISLLGFTGAVNGRIIMELAMDTAVAIGEAMNEEELKPYDKMLFYSLSELSNMFSGKAITTINNGPDRPNLRLTPPNVLVGEGLEVFSDRPKLCTACVEWRGKPVYIHVSLEGATTDVK